MKHTARRSWTLVLFALCVIDVSAQVLGERAAFPAEVARLGTAGPAQLLSPAAGVLLEDVDVELRWRADPTRAAPTRFEICLAAPGTPCVAGRDAWILQDLERLASVGMRQYELGESVVDSPTARRTPITSTTLRFRVPARFQGRPFQWRIAACAPVAERTALTQSGMVERCTLSEARTAGWRIRPPALLPADTRLTARGSPLRPTFAIQARVPWADYYLYCISRPGLACATTPNSSADQLVISTTDVALTPDQPLLQFQGREMRWTAAACNTSFGCAYSPADQSLPFPRSGPPPAAPALTTPATNAWSSAAHRRVSLSWQPVPDAVTYTVCVASPGIACGADGSVELKGLGGYPTGTLTVPSALGPLIHWTVAACNLAQQCTYQPEKRVLRFARGQTETFRLMTYNVYLRPTTMFANGQAERARLLPSQLHGYDAIIFNEAFDDETRAVLLNGLQPEYRYATRILGRDEGVSQDGGVIIVSRWPIAPEDQAVFSACEGLDCQAQKGVNYAKVCKNGKPFHVFGTHLQANHDRVHQGVQTQQLSMIRQFIDRQRIPPTEPVLIGGDFNLRRDNGGTRSAEFAWIERYLRAGYPQIVRDLQPPCTYCNGLNPLASDTDEGQVTLDYIVFSRDHLLPFPDAQIETRRIQSATRWREFFFEPWFTDLSDHYPVVGQFTFEFSDDQRC